MASGEGNEHVARAREHVARVHDATPPVPFPHLVATTLLAVLLTILLGVATKATGSGLACNARWPVCDGGFLNLFPATLPSFFEWIHRAVAGVTGLAILGTAVAAWRRDIPRRVRGAVTVGLVLLPVQVLLGRETVLSFEHPVLVAHFWVAFAIFAAFAVATALIWRDALTSRRLRSVAVVVAALVPMQVLLHPPVVTGYTPTVQTAQYAVTLSTFALVVAVAIGGQEHLAAGGHEHRSGGDHALRSAGDHAHRVGRPAHVAVALPFVHPLLVLAGRHLFSPSPAAMAGYLLLAAVVVGGLLAVALGFHRAT